jgi:cytochrome c oxidase cbb3-type subunit I/II
MQTLGVPYPAGYDKQANKDLVAQGNKIKANLKKDKLDASATSEIVAMIAYLQRVGTDIKLEQKQQTAAIK